MEFKNWLQSVKDYMVDAGVKNPDAVIGKNKNLYNYFYLKKMLPEDVSLHFTDKLSKPTKADYLEILRAKKAVQGTNYADSMVFYKGKALGRCPAGTTRAGKTCVPGASATPNGPGYKQTDLGGLSQAQVQALSKAKSTEDIIKAHKKSNKK